MKKVAYEIFGTAWKERILSMLLGFYSDLRMPKWKKHIENSSKPEKDTAI